MANSKISALTSATTPLAGTETLPVVQSSTTKQVTVADLTAGRAVSGLSFTATGNVTGAALIPSGTTVPTNGWYLPSANVVAIANNSGFTANFDASRNFNLGQATSALQSGGTGITIYGSSYSEIKFLNSTTGTAATDGTALVTSGATFSINNREAGSVTIGTSNTKRIDVDSGGDVTISTGNIIQGTAAKGINFTANTAAAGKTSQLLNWYEEGTWTPTITAGTGTFTTVSSITGIYTRIGRQVTIQGAFTMTDKGTGVTALVSGLPFNPDGTNRYQGVFTNVTDGTAGIVYGRPTNSFWLYKYDGTDGLANGKTYAFEVTYFV